MLLLHSFSVLLKEKHEGSDLHSDLTPILVSSLCSCHFHFEVGTQSIKKFYVTYLVGIFRDLPFLIFVFFISLVTVFRTFFYLCTTILVALNFFSLRIHALLKSLSEAQTDPIPLFPFLSVLLIWILFIAIVLNHEFFVFFESSDDISKLYLFESLRLG